METEHTKHLHYSVKDLSGNKRKGHLHGKLIDGGISRDTSKFAHLGNDITNIELEEGEVYTPSDYIDVIGDSNILTNSLTIAMWINFQGESNPRESLFHTRGDSNKFSFMVNVNDSEGDDELTGLLGYTWNNSKENVSTSEGASTKWKYPFISFEEQIPKNKWTWLVLMLYPSGTSRLFVDNIYTSVYDEGYIRDKLLLKDIEIGRFSGYVDSIYLFSDNLDYGNVEIGQSAKYDLEYLYNTSRTNPLQPKVIQRPPRKKTLYDGIPFYYMQSDEYLEANSEYNNRTQSRVDSGEYLHNVIRSQTQEDLNLQKYEINGGPNSGARVFADNKFMSFVGQLRENS